MMKPNTHTNKQTGNQSTMNNNNNEWFTNINSNNNNQQTDKQTDRQTNFIIWWILTTKITNVLFFYIHESWKLDGFVTNFVVASDVVIFFSSFFSALNYWTLIPKYYKVIDGTRLLNIEFQNSIKYSQFDSMVLNDVMFFLFLSKKIENNPKWSLFRSLLFSGWWCNIDVCF